MGSEEFALRRTAILDIGSSKIVCLYGSMNTKDDVVIHGVSIQEYPGFRYGEFVDRKKTIHAICDAIQKTEAESKVRIREIAVTAPAPFTRLDLKKHSIEIPSQTKRITHTDIDMLINESIAESGSDEALIHSTPVSFRLDGKVHNNVPVGLSGTRLEGVVSHMYVKRSFLDVVEEALASMDIRMNMCVASALSETLFIVPPQERIRPAAVIDVGYTHTDIFVMENAAVTGCSVLEVGGMHFASDLCYGLEIPMLAAERLKRRYVFSLDYQDSEETIRTPKGTQHVSHANVQYIVEARAQEMAELIAAELQKMNITPQSRASVYLMGGGLAQMRGGLEFMEQTLGLPLKSEAPWMPRLNAPAYASALGALEFSLHEEEEEHSIRLPIGQSPVLQKLKNFFNM